MKTDRIVIQVLHQIAERSEKGLEKYGTNLERTDLETLDWVQHAQEEAMDLANYLQVLIDDEYRRTHAPVQD